MIDAAAMQHIGHKTQPILALQGPKSCKITSKQASTLKTVPFNCQMSGNKLTKSCFSCTCSAFNAANCSSFSSAAAAASARTSSPYCGWGPWLLLLPPATRAALLSPGQAARLPTFGRGLDCDEQAMTTPPGKLLPVSGPLGPPLLVLLLLMFSRHGGVIDPDSCCWYICGSSSG